MIFCARATRGLRRPSPGLMARLGVPVGGRVRKLRAVEDQSAPIPWKANKQAWKDQLDDDVRSMRAVETDPPTYHESTAEMPPCQTLSGEADSPGDSSA